jgi:WhiB family redox-sensing transcriptional regulator
MRDRQTVLIIHPSPESVPKHWDDDAACKGYDREMFYRDEHLGGAADTKAAKAICRECPVLAECFTYAYERRLDWGVWGGTTGKERWDIRRREQARALRAQRKAGAA